LHRKRQFLLLAICVAERMQSINCPYWIITQNCIPSLQTPHKVCLSVHRCNTAHNLQCHQKFSLSNSPNNRDTFILHGWKIHINVGRAFKATENHSRWKGNKHFGQFITSFGVTENWLELSKWRYYPLGVNGRSYPMYRWIITANSVCRNYHSIRN
jgi:hypothetical protein